MVKQKMETLNWDIEIKPVYTEGQILLRGYKSILRNDKEIALSVMKDSYHPRSNENFMRVVNELAVIAKTKTPYFSEYDAGRKVLAYLKSPKNTSIAGHKISDQILVGNSFDGSTSLFVATVLSYAGTNFTYMNKKAAFRVSHKSKDLEQCFDYIELMKDYEEEKEFLYNKFNDMSTVEITEEIIEDFIKAVIEYKTHDEEGEEVEISTRTQNKIDAMKLSIEKKLNEHGNNVWGLFNGVTHYTTYEYKGGRKMNIEGNMYGTQNTYNQRALNYCLDLL